MMDTPRCVGIVASIEIGPRMLPLDVCSYGAAELGAALVELRGATLPRSLNLTPEQARAIAAALVLAADLAGA